MGQKILAISIETANPGTIDEGCDAGYLPHLRALRERGSWGAIESVCNISSGSVWPSMYTGCTPANHGVANFHMHLVPGTYHIDRFGPDHVMQPALWNVFAESGKRSLVFDVPLTRPRQPMNGIMVSAWGVEGPAWQRQSHPKDLLRKLDRQFGPYPLPNDDYRRSIRSTTLEGVREMRDLLVEGMRRKSQVLQHLMMTERWDLFIGVFSETHWADHVMYHVIDSEHPDHQPAFREEFGGFYRELLTLQDECIGELLRHAGDDVTVLVFSASGVRPSYYGNHLLPDVLERLDFGSGSPLRNEAPTETESSRSWSYYRIRKIQDTVSTPAIMTAKKFVPRRLWEKWTRRLIFTGERWADSRAFCLPNDYCGNIRINLEGREPHGKVSANDYDAVCAELSRELLALENADSGTPAVEDVLKLRELYPGDHAERLPDLSVVWSDKHPIDALRSPRIGTIRGKNPERRPGAHGNQGFFIAAGPGVAPTGQVRGARIIDLSPTILNLAGLEVPNNMDGSPLPLGDLTASARPREAF